VEYIYSWSEGREVSTGRLISTAVYFLAYHVEYINVNVIFQRVHQYM
jgi:hypothetical protein